MSSGPLPAPLVPTRVSIPAPVAFGFERLELPPKVPSQIQRPTQSNIPDSRAVRDQLRQLAIVRVAEQRLHPPLPMADLREHARAILDAVGLPARYADYVGVLLSNASWSDTLATIPYDRRLLLLPKCLRVEEHCPAPFDEFGLLCKECGLCSLQDFTVEADRLGYAVLVAEGSAIVRQMLETGRIEAVVGVSCLNVLEKSFPHMEAAAVPGIAIPLLQDDCKNCTVDLDWVWDVIHLTSSDRTHRLDLEALKAEVASWFGADDLDAILGTTDDPTARLARQWLAADGKRWRPYLAVCSALALAPDSERPTEGLRERYGRLAVAVECFHKASLAHDDIEDGDARRYGRATLHDAYGIPLALNLGDFLIGEGYRLLTEIDVTAETKVALLRLAAEGHLTLSRGQGRELLWCREREALEPLQVLSIFREKTAPAFDVALRLGALVSGADAGVHDVLRRYSEALGIAYQIRDDLDDATGRSDSDDVADPRPSLVVAIARKRAMGEGEADLLARVQRVGASPADIESARRLLEERGAVAKAKDLLDAYQEEAIRSLRFLENPTLKGLLRRVVGKIFPRPLIEGYCREFEARNAASGAIGHEAPR